MATPRVDIIEQPYFGYVYMWCDTKRNKYYIGSHKGSIFDKYKSGSQWLNNVINKRPETMKIRVLEYYYGSDREELYTLETKWLNFYDVEKNSKYFYNFKNTARGGIGPFKHKGKKRIEYSPNWIDHRKGKKLEDIYKNPDEIRNNLIKGRINYIKTYGHGWKLGTKHVKDKRRGKTVEEIYGYRRLVNPPKPFIITICEKDKESREIYCRHESDFFELVKVDNYSLATLKKTGTKTIQRRQHTMKHDFAVGTVLLLKFVEEKR